MKPNQTRRPSLLLALVALPISLQANESLPLLSETDLLIDIPEVISATHLTQKLTETPAAISIIDRKMIEASGAQNIPDLFRLVPGMSVYHVHSNKFGVSYHGVSDDFPRQMEVMINGRSVYIPLLSTVVWETLGLTTNDIERIEVVRGSNVPTHGSNAFTGAINIITRSPLQDRGTEIQTTQGALGTESYYLRHSASFEGLELTVRGGFYQNDGIERYRDKGLIRHLNIEGVYTPSLIDTFSFSLGFNNGYVDRGDGNREDPEEAEFITREHESSSQSLQWNRIIDPEHAYQISYQHHYLNMETPRYSDAELQVLLEESFGPLPPGTGAELNALNPTGIFKDSETGKTESHDIEFLHTLTKPGIEAVVGAGYRYERAKSGALLQQANNRWLDENRWRMFGNIELKTIPDWVFNIGGMLEHSSIAGTRFSPRLAANYLLDGDSSIRTAVTQAYRMPSLLSANNAFTLHFPLGVDDDIYTKPNPDLGPEKINSAEIGYFTLFPHINSQLDVRIFYEDIDDAIGSFFVDADDLDNRYIIQENGYDWTNQGFEFQFKYASKASHASSALFNYSYNNVKGDRDRGNKGVQRLDEAAPLHLASLLLSTKPTAHSSVSLAQYYLHKVRWLEGNDDDYPDYRYNRTDLRLGYDFNLDWGSQLSAALVIQNLFDRRYSEFYHFNTFDRRTYLQLTFKF
ncbi:TonB-dependent receptor [Neptuniibacter sp. CAU 1671]|uniref:TonB-dependent receptor plug domain-containing protein n=1 Tax=Neptuniibacter sp. CAU 1671 TaxID=3032593 RepID=UPI0023DA8307|nr:TonB-dependent receptor [Neptuniibacter sp. CAU 1671]MDF2181602.1 TonB-dependent receptor [Neptuniibacter sp. CAU 1671]